jgi:hypothetical protein
MYDASKLEISATVTHFSIWSVLSADTAKLRAAAGHALDGFLGIGDHVGQPACPEGDELTANRIMVTSDKGDLVKWCAGVSNSGGPVLQVANNRDYPVEADYPAQWMVHRLGALDPILAQITTSVTHILSPVQTGMASTIIPGGGTVEFDLPPTTSGRVEISPSSEGYLIAAILYGADTLDMTLDDLPGAPHSNPTNTVKAVQAAFTVKDCVDAFDRYAQADITSAAAVGEMFRGVVDTAVSCLGSQIKQAYGIKGVIGKFVISTVLWLVDGIKLVLEGGRALIDTVLFWRAYRIDIAQTPQPFQPFAGQWFLHAGTISISGDGSVKILWFVNSFGSSQPSGGNIELDLQIVSAAGTTATARVTGRTVPAGLNALTGPGVGPNLQIGDSYTLTLEAPGIVGTGRTGTNRWCDPSHYGECGA